MEDLPLKAVMGGTGLVELFEFLAYHKKSGVLELRASGYARRLRLCRGRLAAADGHEGAEAERTAAGAIYELIELGLDEAEFTPTEPGASAEGGERGAALSSVAAGVRELEARWREIRQDLPSMRCRLRLSRTPIGQGGSVTVESEEWAVVFALAKPGTVEDVWSEVGGSALDCATLVHGMLKKGLLEVLEVPADDVDQAKVTPASVSTSQEASGHPADLLVHGMTEVLAEVTAEMTGLSKGQAKKNIQAGNLDAQERSEVPPEWQAYYTRLESEPDEDAGEASG